MTEAEVRPVMRLTQSKFKLQQFAFNTYLAQPDYGVALQDLLEDGYWRHVSSKMAVGDHIEVHPEGLTYYAKLIVVDCGPVFAKVKLLQFTDLVGEQKMPEQAPIVAEVDLGKYKVERAGQWFRILRLADKEVMKTGFRSMKAAELWAAENLQVKA